jgi:hypothetical protein
VKTTFSAKTHFTPNDKARLQNFCVQGKNFPVSKTYENKEERFFKFQSILNLKAIFHVKIPYFIAQRKINCLSFLDFH